MVPNLGIANLATSEAKSNECFDVLVKTKVDIENTADNAVRMSVLDIPGLLNGAHNGVGLGNAFLRHIHKCKLVNL